MIRVSHHSQSADETPFRPVPTGAAWLILEEGR